MFKFDEEISKLTFNGSCAIIDDYDDTDDNTSINNTHSIEIDDMVMSNTVSSRFYVSDLSPDPLHTHPKHTRKSSLYDKFSITAPLNVRKFSLDQACNEERPLYMEENDFSHIHGRRLLEDFKPIRVLGQGAYGKVILVKDQFTSKLYAMKQLKKAEILIVDKKDENITLSDTASVDKRIERTFAERIILSQLEHPHIVKLFYSFHDNHKLYLILQYIPGGELFYHLKEYGTLNEDVASFYAAEISCALKFLHDRCIVYRDLKPENCLLNERGHLILTDFGLSKKSVFDSDNTTEGESVDSLFSIIGTPEYCAPEILEGKSYTQNCDWYSLGCLVYDMLLGKPPYTGINYKVILNKIRTDKRSKIPTYLSDGMNDFLSALLKKDVEKRWDVDKYWNQDGLKPKKRKSGQPKTSSFQSHFIFRKINWKLLENGSLQNTTSGPILPSITDWELAENFDTEFTEMRLDSDIYENGIDIVKEMGTKRDLFKGFSFVASNSYLDRYF